MIQTDIKKRGSTVVCMILLFAVVCLAGCGNGESGDGIDAAALFAEAMEQLEEAGAYSYEVETTTRQADTSLGRTSRTSFICQPYARFSETRSDMIDGTEMKIQIYQRENSDGSMDSFGRSNVNGEEVFGEWNLSHMTPELAEMGLSGVKDGMKRNIELLRANADSFKGDGRQRIEDRDTVVLKGTVTPDSAARVYNDFIRPYYRQLGLVEDRALTVQEAKDEIRAGEIVDLQSGIPALAFSQRDLAVTLWIDEETRLPVRMELDETGAMEALLGAEEIEKAVTIYRLLEIGEQVSVLTPEGIE